MNECLDLGSQEVVSFLAETYLGSFRHICCDGEDDLSKFWWNTFGGVIAHKVAETPFDYLLLRGFDVMAPQFQLGMFVLGGI